MNAETIDALGDINELTKEDYTEKLQDHMITAQEHKMVSQNINDKMKDMLEDEDDLEDANVRLI